MVQNKTKVNVWVKFLVRMKFSFKVTNRVSWFRFRFRVKLGLVLSLWLGLNLGLCLGLGLGL